MRNHLKTTSKPKQTHDRQGISEAISKLFPSSHSSISVHMTKKSLNSFITAHKPKGPLNIKYFAPKKPKERINKSCSSNNIYLNTTTNPLKNSNNDEVLELQLKLSRKENELRISNEKISSLNQIISMKETENDLLKTKYNGYINEFQAEIGKLNKVNNEFKVYKSNYENAVATIKGIINVLSDLIEIFLNKNSHTHRSILSGKNEASIDMYDSFDEDKRNSLTNQIQNLLICKFRAIEKALSIQLDKEIERIQILNYNTNNNNISNISNIIKGINIENSNSNSYNEFDLSVSKTFYNQSPKFNSFMKEKSNNISYGSFCENINNNSYNHRHNYSITNIMMPKSKSIKGSSTNNMSVNINIPGGVNFLDCSFGETA